jgi:hypothetical protein
VGIATTYYLAVLHKRPRLLIIDEGQPMTLTSAQSGENYRNWWPHPTMTAFTDYSIGLMEGLARKTDNRLHMTRRGYLLCTRDGNPEALLRQLYVGYGAEAERAIRIHDGTGQMGYQPPESADWELAPKGVDVLCGQGLIGKHFPYPANAPCDTYYGATASRVDHQYLYGLGLRAEPDVPDIRRLQGRTCCVHEDLCRSVCGRQCEDEQRASRMDRQLAGDRRASKIGSYATVRHERRDCSYDCFPRL